MRWFLFLCTLASSRCFRICSFNIQCFGESKGAKPVVMEIITKIVARCDICLLMEVRDSSGAVVDQLLQDLNRSDMVKITSSYQYKGGKKGLQTFAREPLIVRFSSPRTAIKDFVLIPLHAPPGEAVNEIDQLYNVFLDVRAKWDIEDIMILGDLNADCRYVSAKDWETIRLRNKPGFFWLIGDNQDTTASARTDCAYDRIIVHGWNFFKALVPGSAKVFNVQEEFKLTEKEAVEVSDHYPVEVKLKLEAVHYEL
ncbi:deoxyribonuclease gamma-like isoform X2 [Scyliorhinus canicula]|uniref:deoxyribonuclease gamma-like isoform X2 n=1 Tax=Scyliorhinus canicula TaxID=7830 RepID=UPI0018F46A76|nr:deoxyribonuclease gamma-like isoform X2 [Scyliorhinus canicula]